MVNYDNGIIYKIVCKDINVKDLYVGSTCNFTRRRTGHKHHYFNKDGKKYNYNVYEAIRNNGGWSNWSMIEIEKYKCNDINELHKRERYYIELLQATLNKVIPSRTKTEYTKDNADNTKEYRKIYNKENTEKIKESLKTYHKNNKDDIKQQRAEHYELNKEKIKAKVNENAIIRVKCEYCDKLYRKDGIKKHIKSIHKI